MRAEGAAQAPELQVSQWFNTTDAPTLASLRGRIVVIEAFQMLCPGCVEYGLPQARTIRSLFREEDVVVLGLHTVFEHHDAMRPVSLAAFLHEYRIDFPVAVDAAGNGPTPRTMAAYGLRGTPSLLLVDREGRLRANHVGHVHDMQVGAGIASLLAGDRGGRAQELPHDWKVDDAVSSGSSCRAPRTA